jgi:hypothetical protein
MLPPLIRFQLTEQTATILFRLPPVSTAPLTTALLRNRHALLLVSRMLRDEPDMCAATFAGALPASLTARSDKAIY